MIKKTNNNFNLKKTKEEILIKKKALMNLNFQKSTGQLEKTSEIKVALEKDSKLLILSLKPTKPPKAMLPIEKVIF